MKVLVILAIAILMIAFGPILTIWAANTLFPILAIPYTFETWLAVVLLGMFFRANVSVSK